MSCFYHNNRVISRFFIVVIVVTMLLGVPGLIVGGENARAESVDETTGLEFSSLKELEGKKYAAVRGTIQEQSIPNYIPGADPEVYNSAADVIAALKSGKVEVFYGSVSLVKRWAKQNPDLGYIDEAVDSCYNGFAFQEGSELKAKFDSIIEKYRQDGTLQELEDIWLGDDESKKVIDKSGLTGENGTIRLWVDATTVPMMYVDDSGEIVGYEMDLASRIATELGMNIEVTSTEFDGLLAALQAGKCDMISSSITITEEREKLVDFSEPIFDDKTLALVRKTGVTMEEQGFFSSIGESFYRTFVLEDRWKMILSGLLITIIISIASAIAGLVFGFGLCMLRRSRFKVLSKAVAVFVRVIQGTPIIVLLMILFYIIFGKVDVSGTIIAVVGFSINFAAYSSEIMRSGIEAVDSGQREAALALGFTNAKSFSLVVFPQAATHFIPVLKGEFISMVKMTSVVGYIAVEDLTKISDIIRARTMDAFFPLISTAVIYFALANILILVISLFEKRIDIKRRPRRVKL